MVDGTSERSGDDKSTDESTSTGDGSGEDDVGRRSDPNPEFVELLDDVRERVVQVKQETDTKAPKDHDHQQLIEHAASIAELEASVSTVETAVTDLDSTVRALDEKLETGFENYEDVLEHVVETTDRVDDRIDVIAEALTSVRAQQEKNRRRFNRREKTRRLKEDANRKDTETATCGECGNRVRIALLVEPECPHCSSSFSELELRTAVFGLFDGARLCTDTDRAIPDRPLDPDADE
ncbi:MAG: hypothetical protein ACQETB_02675 [Halobacteriota archaeon]